MCTAWPRSLVALLLLAATAACAGDPASPATARSAAEPTLAMGSKATDEHAKKGHGSDAQAAAGTESIHGRGDVARDLATLTRLTAPFRRFDAAEEAGWSMQLTGCLSLPGAGAMGYHYGNPQFIDGQVAVDEPELLVYEPQKNGRLRLVAVEYIVPFDAWGASEPPRLFDRDFYRNEEAGLWALHVWLWRHNPPGCSGIIRTCTGLRPTSSTASAASPDTCGATGTPPATAGRDRREQRPLRATP